MKAAKYILLILVVFAFSCSGDPANNAENTVIDTPVKPAGPVLNEQIGNHIKLTFEKDSNSLTTTAHLDSGFASVICFLEVTKGKRLTASVETNTKTSNIRFNQVSLPNGTSDGPFGKTLDYALKEPGLYKIHIAPSMMADRPYYGNFILKVKVE